MSTYYHQISLKDTFSDCQDLFTDDTPAFFRIPDKYVDLSQFIPQKFFNAFYQKLGHKRIYPLTGVLSALILQKVFPIPTDSLLILFLNLCKELRDFCGFSNLPNASLFTRFKQDFLPYIKTLFLLMVDFTEPLCQNIDSSLADMLTSDTSGIELYVTENDPKTLNSLIKKLKTYYKDNPGVESHKMAYALMSKATASRTDAKQQYINGHFCYADKFAILTNGLGIVRHIVFLDDDFKAAHPDMPVKKKSDSPDDDKSIGDSSSLKAVLSDFFSLHPLFKPDTFLGDSAFDTIETYGFLRDEFHFSKVLIPYNTRNKSTLQGVGYNFYGYPTRPRDSSLDMKYAKHCHEKGRSDRDKWVCPKVHIVKGQ